MKKWLLVVIVVFAILPFVVGGDFGCCLGEEVYCAYVTQDSCDGDWNGDMSCSNEDECTAGCCVFDDGTCSEGAVQSGCVGDDVVSWTEGVCYEEEGDAVVSDCDPGCCIVEGTYEYITELDCNYRYENSGFDYSWDDWTLEACISEVEGDVKGCCVSGDQCSYDSAEYCSGDFYAGKNCEDIGDYATCDCSETEEYVCYYGNEIYQVNTCGDQVYVETCTEGESCNGVQSSCVSVDCDNTFSFLSQTEFGKFNSYDVYYEDSGVWKKEEFTLGGRTMKNGESWCIYEGPTGSFKDRVGSQHYLAECSYGEEIIGNLAADRSEICVMSYDPDTGMFSGYWEENNFAEYYGVDYHPNDTANDFETIIEDYYYYVVDPVDLTENYLGGVSTVPLATQNFCHNADFICEVVYGQATVSFDDSWEPYINAYCFRKKFSLTAAEYCSSRGDCGLNYNLLGESGLDSSFIIEYDSFSKEDVTLGCGEDCFDPEKEHGGADMADALQCGDLSGCKTYDFSSIKEDFFDYYSSIQGIIPDFLSEAMLPSFVSPESVYEDTQIYFGNNLVAALGGNLEFFLSGEDSICSDSNYQSEYCFIHAVDLTSQDKSCSSSTSTVCAYWTDCQYDEEDNSCLSGCSCSCVEGNVNKPIIWDGDSWVKNVYVDGSLYNTQVVDEESCCEYSIGFWEDSYCLDSFSEIYDDCYEVIDEACISGESSLPYYSLFNSLRSVKPWVLDQSSLRFFSRLDGTQEWVSDYRTVTKYIGPYLGESEATVGGNTNEWEDVYGDYQKGRGGMDVAELEYQCSAWVGQDIPDKDDREYQCNLCDKSAKNGGLKWGDAAFCNPYRCASLSSGCTYIEGNEGSSRATCVANDCEESNGPTITPYYNFFEAQGKPYTESDTGYTVEELDKSIYYFGVETEEYSRCKFIDYYSVIEPALMDEYGIYDVPVLFPELVADSELSPEEALYEYFSGEGVYETPSDGDEGEYEGYGLVHKTKDSFSQANQEERFFVFCKDTCGNVNMDHYQINLIAGNDIEKTSFPNGNTNFYVNPASGSQLPYGTETQSVELSFDREATCKYTQYDNVEYDSMDGEASVCSSGEGLLDYYCRFSLDIVDGTNIYYFSCEDIFGNILQPTEQWTVSVTDALVIDSTSPTGTLYNNVVDLEVITTGGSDGGGIATCEGKRSDLTSYWEFGGAGTNLHYVNDLTLNEAYYEYDVKCEDTVGNTVEDVISFEVAVDSSASEIVSAYYLNPKVYITTSEHSSCKYSSESFDYDTGGSGMTANTNSDGEAVWHSFTVGESSIYYIICQDYYANVGDEFIIGIDF